jgi:hypothetical protein
MQVFNGMAQFYRCFIKNFAYVMAPITKLLKKMEVLGGYQESIHSSFYIYQS